MNSGPKQKPSKYTETTNVARISDVWWKSLSRFSTPGANMDEASGLGGGGSATPSGRGEGTLRDKGDEGDEAEVAPFLRGGPVDGVGGVVVAVPPYLVGVCGGGFVLGGRDVPVGGGVRALEAVGVEAARAVELLALELRGEVGVDALLEGFPGLWVGYALRGLDGVEVDSRGRHGGSDSAYNGVGINL